MSKLYIIKVDPTDAMIVATLESVMTKQELEDNVISLGAHEALVTFESEEDVRAATQLIREQTGRLIPFVVADEE